MWKFDFKSRRWIWVPDEYFSEPSNDELRSYGEVNRTLEVIEEHCRWYNSGKIDSSPAIIYRALATSGIRTLDDLKNADDDRMARVRRYRGIGDKRFALIMILKLSLE